MPRSTGNPADYRPVNRLSQGDFVDMVQNVTGDERAALREKAVMEQAARIQADPRWKAGAVRNLVCGCWHLTDEQYEVVTACTIARTRPHGDSCRALLNEVALQADYMPEVIDGVVQRLSTYIGGPMNHSADVPGECNACLYLGDDAGDNTCTIRCTLPTGHEGPHMERFERKARRESGRVQIMWERDERSLCPDCGKPMREFCADCFMNEDYDDAGEDSTDA